MRRGRGHGTYRRDGAPASRTLALWTVCWLAAALAAAEKPNWRHGHSHFGGLDYPADYEHFRWVNPEAPRGGSLTMGRSGIWDSFNPFITRGKPADGVRPGGVGILLYDRLLERSSDELSAAYGRLASGVAWAPDHSWIAFRLRPEARWHDGRPITARDVVYTLEMLRDHGAPEFRMLYRGVSAEAEGDRVVRFSIPEGSRNASLLGDIGQLYPLPEHAADSHPFESAWSQPPLGSGPYRVADHMLNRRVRYERVPDYWGDDLPVNRGRYNFDAIEVEYFLDRTAARSAIKAGDIDYWREGSAATWDRGYDVPAVHEGLLRKRVAKRMNGGGLGGLPIILNLRLEKFQDVRVREALYWANDFEWVNRVIYHGQYERADSFFANSALAARGLPSPGELALLEPLRGRVPARVFTSEREVPRSRGFGPPRENLLRAERLLREAGWVVREGRRVHVQSGEPFTIEFVFRGESGRVVEIYMRNLERLGIETRARRIDKTNFMTRMRLRDFEATFTPMREALIPGPELRARFGSEAADQEFADNYFGIRDPAVDHLVEAVIGARSQRELEVAGRALDRVLLWSFYAIPGFIEIGERELFWDLFGRPERGGSYRRDFPNTWWFDEERARDTRERARALGIGGR